MNEDDEFFANCVPRWVNVTNKDGSILHCNVDPPDGKSMCDSLVFRDLGEHIVECKECHRRVHLQADFILVPVLDRRDL